MTTQFTWTISRLDCYPQVGTETDVVTTAHWQCTGTNGAYNAQVYSTCSFPVPDADNFTPYADLTQDTVLNWCWSNGVDKDATEAAVQTQIDNQINPPIVSPALPWSN